MNIPRPEHPKPQFMRENWMNLNGEWQFEIDNARNGICKDWQNPEHVFKEKIIVPFCPQSVLSKIGNTDFMRGVWYKRSVTLSEEQIKNRVMLHFGAVDYETTVFVNGKKAGTHKGGYISFFFEITKLVKAGENVITLFAADDETSNSIPKGKQSQKYESWACFYTRTTGIWQTVWLEFLPESYIESAKYYPNVSDSSVTIVAKVKGKGEFSAKAFFDGRGVGEASASAQDGVVSVKLDLSEKHLWTVGEGNLYDLELKFNADRVKSYFGLRCVSMSDKKFLLNGKSVFQRLVLDQGFYPDGIYTAPSDKVLENDILLSMKAGFNGARLHEKIFEERFLYYCDKHGYMVWGEYPDWGVDTGYEAICNISEEWAAEIERDFNHPSIIGWCPLNEKNHMDFRPTVRHLFELTKRLDNTRLILDVSGYVHNEDCPIFDEHNYAQNPEDFVKRYNVDMMNGEIYDQIDRSLKWENQPFFVSEFGGIKWSSEQGKAWGYGNAPKTEEEYFSRLKGLCDVLLNHPYMFGFCFTQLTDVELEQNGVYRYDRSEKLDTEKFRKIISRKAKSEE